MRPSPAGTRPIMVTTRDIEFHRSTVFAIQVNTGSWKFPLESLGNPRIQCSKDTFTFRLGLFNQGTTPNGKRNANSSGFNALPLDLTARPDDRTRTGLPTTTRLPFTDAADPSPPSPTTFGSRTLTGFVDQQYVTKSAAGSKTAGLLPHRRQSLSPASPASEH